MARKGPQDPSGKKFSYGVRNALAWLLLTGTLPKRSRPAGFSFMYDYARDEDGNLLFTEDGKRLRGVVQPDFLLHAKSSRLYKAGRYLIEQGFQVADEQYATVKMVRMVHPDGTKAFVTEGGNAYKEDLTGKMHHCAINGALAKFDNGWTVKDDGVICKGSPRA